MKDHHPRCPLLAAWDHGDYQAPCTCPEGWPRETYPGAGQTSTEAKKAMGGT